MPENNHDDNCHTVCSHHIDTCDKIIEMADWLNGKHDREGFKSDWHLASHKIDMMYKIMWTTIFFVASVVGGAVLAVVIRGVK